MIIDSSAVVAICAGEPGAERVLTAARSAPSLRMAAPSFVETTVVLDRRDTGSAGRRVDRLLQLLGTTIEPFTEAHARLARQAYRDYGRGSGHPARLNLGDCFAYALAIETGEPLLFVGDDFTHTDVRAALPGLPTRE